MEMSLGELTALLRHLLSQEQVHVHGSEEAGLQVLGLIESRGLSFDKLYVLGLSAGSLPRPVRPLPLLDVQERPLVQGATVESQFTFAREAFGHLLACAPHHTILMRPEEDSAEPLAPSPFFTEAVSRESRPVMDVWNAPDPAWSRAAWLQQAKQGLENGSDFPPSDQPLEAHQLPDTVSVARLATAFACPFRFFVETVFKLVPLDELILGISPRDRGNVLHRVLAHFTRRCRGLREAGTLPRSDTMEATLVACVDEVLASCGKAKDSAHRHGWTMERRRWIGDAGDSPGLLKAWLALEQERVEAGWQWLAEESSFDGLTFPDWPFSVTGRVDRIDSHEEEGITLWDYKSGDHPTARAVMEGLIDPQLPAYLEAARAKRIVGIEKALETDTTMSAGYITLKRASSVAHKVLKPRGEDWEQVLVRWRDAVARLGKILVSGELEAMPFPVSDGGDSQKACRFCPYGPLCGRKETDR
jgi:ATP-dependent helicase/DNAse subunit B